MSTNHLTPRQQAYAQTVALDAEIAAFRKQTGCDFQTAFNAVANRDPLAKVQALTAQLQRGGLGFDAAFRLVTLNADAPPSDGDFITFAELAEHVGVSQDMAAHNYLTVVTELVEVIRAGVAEQFPEKATPLSALSAQVTGYPRRALALALGLPESATKEQVLAEVGRLYNLTHPNAEQQKHYTNRLQAIGEGGLSFLTAAKSRDDLRTEVTALNARVADYQREHRCDFQAAWNAVANQPAPQPLPASELAMPFAIPGVVRLTALSVSLKAAAC